MAWYPTSVDEEYYNVKLIYCGDDIEIYKYRGGGVRLNKITRNKDKEKQREKIERTDEEKLMIRKKYLNKTKNNICRLIKCNSDMNFFFTLTFSEEPTVEESKKKLHNFLVKVRKVYGDIKYLWVVERGEEKEGKEGRLHFHMLTNIPLPTHFKYAKSRERKCEDHKSIEREFKEKFWNYGWVDIRQLQHEGIGNIAGYMTAYVTKSMLDLGLINQQVSNHSRNLNKPVVDTYITCDDIEEFVKNDLYNVQFMNSYRFGNEGKVVYVELKAKQ